MRRRGRGRPIRFIILVTALWAGGRALVVWPGMGAPWRAPRFAYAPALPPIPAAGRFKRQRPSPARRWPIAPSGETPSLLARAAPVAPERAGYDGRQFAQHIAYIQGYGTPPALARMIFTGGGRPGARAVPADRRLLSEGGGRLSFSGWGILRAGGGANLAGGAGQLGGSQAGLRAALTLGRSREMALFGRVSSPLSTPGGREAALGLEWRPLKAVPIRFAAERRQSIGGGRNAFALGLFGGIGPKPLTHGFSLDAYGQAGMVGARRRDGYIDGALRVERELVSAGALSISAGAGAWGGMQPGVARLDIGPQIVARVPTAGATLRLGFEWRQRIGGHARPGSGPVFSVGTDF